MSNSNGGSSSEHSTALKEENKPREVHPDPSVSRADKHLPDVGKGRHLLRDRPWLALTGLVVAVAALVGLGYLVRDAFLFENTDDAQVDGHIMPLSARINGYVLEVRVIEGQLVHAGDVLVTIDPKDYKIALEQARARVENAQASAASSRFNIPITSVTTQSNVDSASTAVENAEAGFKAAEQNLESAKAVVEQAEANAAKIDADLVRYEQLVAKEDISHQQYDQAVAAAKANRSGVVSARANVQAAEA